MAHKGAHQEATTPTSDEEQDSVVKRTRTSVCVAVEEECVLSRGGVSALASVCGVSVSPPLLSSCRVLKAAHCPGQLQPTEPEGQRSGGEARRRGRAVGRPSVAEDSVMAGGSAGLLQQAQGQGAAPPRDLGTPVDPATYSSDEWEESDLSDTDGDHSDSSDDDNPRSQVDKLIEKVTQVYLDGENSALSSETESSSSSSSDEDEELSSDSDSEESDMTDVSPLISATASPLGLSPVLPRRVLGTSPLALHDNRELGLAGHADEEEEDEDEHEDDDEDSYHHHHHHHRHHHHRHHHHRAEDGAAPSLQYHYQHHLTVPRPHPHGEYGRGAQDMSVLLQAVVELEEQQQHQRRRRQEGGGTGGKRARRHRSSRHSVPHAHAEAEGTTNTDVPDTTHHLHAPARSPPMAIHPIDASPHTQHLRRGQLRRKNMSFPNEEVRRIDRENRILLQKIMNAHSSNAPTHANTSKHHHTNHHHHNHHHSPSPSSTTTTTSATSLPGNIHTQRHRPANATVNRRREEEKIRRENMILLRKIQEAKPSREVTAFRTPRHHSHHNHHHHHHHHHNHRPAPSLATAPGSCGASARTASGHGHVGTAATPRKETAL